MTSFIRLFCFFFPALFLYCPTNGSPFRSMCVRLLSCLVFSLPSQLFFSSLFSDLNPAPLTLPPSLSPLLLHLPLALPPSLMGNNIYQSPAEPCSTSCHGSQPHHSISSLPFSPLRPPHPAPLPILPSSVLSPPSLRGGSLNCKWASWPLCERSSEVNHR